MIANVHGGLPNVHPNIGDFPELYDDLVAPPNSAENGCWLLAISQFHTEMGKGGVENPIPLSTENVGVETTQQYRMGADHLL